MKTCSLYPGVQARCTRLEANAFGDLPTEVSAIEPWLRKGVYHRNIQSQSLTLLVLGSVREPAVFSPATGNPRQCVAFPCRIGRSSREKAICRHH